MYHSNTKNRYRYTRTHSKCTQETLPYTNTHNISLYLSFLDSARERKLQLTNSIYMIFLGFPNEKMEWIYISSNIIKIVHNRRCNITLSNEI